ncbi:Transcription factor iws1 [Dimargaris verticillata]|uniref:Transcription factor iws1 n=1 Tax=Dimargaris verticillata TaxID=2761393 RepID=A0A9W8EB86_9FUNG|nr:Transcription factor iws1 [Dimargaris verticillata]
MSQDAKHPAKADDFDADLFGEGGANGSDLSDLGELSSGDELNDKSATAAKPGADQNDDRPALPSFKRRRDGASFNQRDKAATADDRPASRSRLDANRAPRRREWDDDDEAEAPPAEPVDPKKAIVDQVRQDFDAALKIGVSSRRRKNDIDLENQVDEIVARLRERMKEMAELDRLHNSEKRPAIGKVGMLPLVTEQLRKAVYQDQLLEGGILDAVRVWLEPLDDGALPALDIQVELFDFIEKLPIRTEHLRESGLGRIVMFFSKCPRVDPRIQRKADELVLKWSRPIIQRSTSYKDRSLHRTGEFGRSRPGATPARGRNTGQLDLTADVPTNRVRVPRHLAPSYDVMPSVSPLVRQLAATNRQQPEHYKRLKARMNKNRSRASNR